MTLLFRTRGATQLDSSASATDRYLASLPAMDTESSAAGPSSAPPEKKKPIVIITIGMAGAGKSTFVQQINSYLHSKQPPSPPYVLNLDPAVANTPFEANIDIRDTVDYHKVMKECVPLTCTDRL